MASTVMMMGSTSSGKTSFMVAAYHLFGDRGINGISVRSTNNHEFFVREWPNLKRGVYNNTAGNVKYLNYDFQLYHRGEPLFNFTWYDYRGGALTDRNDREHDEVVSRIVGSQGVLVFVDGELLSYGNSSKLNNFLERVNEVLFKLDGKLANLTCPDMNCAFVITKCDKISASSLRRHLSDDGSKFALLKSGRYIDGSYMSRIVMDVLQISSYRGQCKNIDRAFARFLVQLCDYEYHCCNLEKIYNQQLANNASRKRGFLDGIFGDGPEERSRSYKREAEGFADMGNRIAAAKSCLEGIL